MKNFSLKFLDIMVGVVLGLGFQWWPTLQEPWQYIAFVFVYLDIVDYWIDYAPSLKKFPPKREIDVLLDVAIMFILFLYIYATQLTIAYFLTVFIIFRILDYLWLLSSKHEFHPSGTDKIFVDTWMQFNLVEVFATAGFIVVAAWSSLAPIFIVVSFIVFRGIMRVLASMRYKKVHFS